MPLRVLDAVCEPAKQINDDIWGQGGGAVWVLDGATGLSPKPLIGEDADAAWFVRQVDGALAEALAVPRPTPESLQAAVQAAAAQARRRCRIDEVPHYELPCASLVMAREVEGRLELVNLGDCVMVWRGAGPARRFGSADVLADLEGKLHRLLDEVVAAGRPREEGVARAAAQARENRRLMNRPGGYPILDLFGDGLAGVEIGLCPEAAPLHLLLMSDGFSRLVETYGVCDWQGLMDLALSEGLASLQARLRAIEADDEDCLKHQRFKPRDDSTAVLVRWE